MARTQVDLAQAVGIMSTMTTRENHSDTKHSRSATAQYSSILRHYAVMPDGKKVAIRWWVYLDMKEAGVPKIE